MALPCVACDHARGSRVGVRASSRSSGVLYHRGMTTLKVVARSVLDWDSIDTVLVDMDGTLLDLNFDNVFWREHRSAALRAVARHDRRGRAGCVGAALRGQGRHSRVVLPRSLDARPRARLEDAEARASRAHSLLPGAQDFLAGVRARGKRLSIVTNAHRDTFAVKAQRHGHRAPRRQRRLLARLRRAEGSAEFWQALERHAPFDVHAHRADRG